MRRRKPLGGVPVPLEALVAGFAQWEALAYMGPVDHVLMFDNIQDTLTFVREMRELRVAEFTAGDLSVRFIQESPQLAFDPDEELPEESEHFVFGPPSGVKSDA